MSCLLLPRRLIIAQCSLCSHPFKERIRKEYAHARMRVLSQAFAYLLVKGSEEFWVNGPDILPSIFFFKEIFTIETSKAYSVLILIISDYTSFCQTYSPNVAVMTRQYFQPFKKHQIHDRQSRFLISYPSCHKPKVWVSSHLAPQVNSVVVCVFDQDCQVEGELLFIHAYNSRLALKTKLLKQAATGQQLPKKAITVACIYKSCVECKEGRIALILFRKVKNSVATTQQRTTSIIYVHQTSGQVVSLCI